MTIVGINPNLEAELAGSLDFIAKWGDNPFETVFYVLNGEGSRCQILSSRLSKILFSLTNQNAPPSQSISGQIGIFIPNWIRGTAVQISAKGPTAASGYTGPSYLMRAVVQTESAIPVDMNVPFYAGPGFSVFDSTLLLADGKPRGVDVDVTRAAAGDKNHFSETLAIYPYFVNKTTGVLLGIPGTPGVAAAYELYVSAQRRPTSLEVV